MKSFARYFSLLISIVFAIALLSVPTRGQTATVYQLNANPLAQISGSPGSPTLKPAYSAAIALNPNLGIVHQISGDSAVSATTTVTTPNGGQFGQIMITIVTASGAGTITATFGTGFLPTATVAPTTGKSISVLWVSDGTASWHEVARSASAQ